MISRSLLPKFLQCDVDVVGIAGPEAEAELMLLAVEVFQRLELPITLRWNNRRFLGEILEAIGVPSDEALSVMLTLDKMEKIEKDGVIKELATKGLDSRAIDAIKDFILLANPTFENLSGTYEIQQSPGAQEVRALQEIIRRTGLGRVCKFDPFLSRGLSFYTGTVYEIFDASHTFGSSLGGGGRYDAIIGQLVGREDISYPTAGISFGMESIMEMLQNRPVQTEETRVTVIPIGDTTVAEALQSAAMLRAAGIRTS